MEEEKERIFLGQRCIISKQNGNEDFVGLIYESGKGENGEGHVTISFPLGYHLSSSNVEDGLRQDALLLMNILSRIIGQNEKHKESKIKDEAQIFSKGSFPLQAYLFVINDFISRGYYKETEEQYKCSQRGKINWPRTIKTQKPYIQDNEAYYLKFITKNTRVKDDELITLIHEYCVYESFEKMGWLISTNYKPEKPRLKIKKEQKEQTDFYISVIDEKLRNTFNDRNRALFQNMKAIIEWQADPDADDKYILGTNDFEYVWEGMIDKVYGSYAGKDKEDYYPNTTWWISNPNEEQYTNKHPLRPDTIMIYNEKFYILDAKYYSYGDDAQPSSLPKTSSIQKQITYGEYIATDEKKFSKYKDGNIYNAFLLPFDADAEDTDKKFNNNGEPLYYVGYATGEWKENDKPYEHVLAILLDVKHLMKCCSNIDNNEEKNKLANIIDKEIKSIIEKENRSIESMKNSLK